MTQKGDLFRGGSHRTAGSSRRIPGSAREAGGRRGPARPHRGAPLSWSQVTGRHSQIALSRMARPLLDSRARALSSTTTDVFGCVSASLNKSTRLDIPLWARLEGPRMFSVNLKGLSALMETIIINYWILKLYLTENFLLWRGYRRKFVWQWRLKQVKKHIWKVIYL